MGADFNQAVEAFRTGDLERARLLAESQISAMPSPDAQHLLGLIYCRLGDPASGVEFLAKAAAAEPENSRFRVMLMRALVDSGRAAEVLRMPKPPAIQSAATLELWRARAEAADAAAEKNMSIEAWSRVAAATPTDWRAWANLGNGHAALAGWRDAADAFSKAATLNPAELEVQRNAASAFLHLDELERAIGPLTAVAEAQPDLVENWILLAHVLSKTRMYDKAEAALERAYALDPTNEVVVFKYGVALERNNKISLLAKLLREAPGAGPDKNSLNYLRAVLARREGKLEKAHELLLHSAPDKGDPVSWHHLRTRLADALGNTEEAFEAASAMNRLTLDLEIPPADREAWQRSAAAYRQEQRELARIITPRWASRVPVLSEPAPRMPAFLVGFPRSGTTLLDTFLMGHRSILVLEEEQLVGKATLGKKVGDLPRLSIDFLKESRARYLDALSERVGDAFQGTVIDKFPLDMASVPFIHGMFPGAPIIFAQRHPCDVVLSGFMQTFGTVNFNRIEDAADYYDAMMSVWTASKDVLDLNSHTIAYEDLIKDPEPVLRGLIDFLGLEWDKDLLDHQRTARSRGVIATPSYDQVTEPLSQRPVGRWRRYEKQLQPVLPILLPWAKRLGYEG